ncbi:hypothetical protein O181_052923 [Austropuccinia psidii MF-1]|uniref:MULE transposase domain-containing protein n=1 Tax=Austropuccinia psidii MF-1 TaxID=1389203 RepID=A0A9Q3E6G3_9BASI|nr:hypothetical protein [Austropuccinia psidii MF-1]
MNNSHSLLTQINSITPLDVSLHIFTFIHYTFTDLNTYIVKLKPPPLARFNDLDTLIQFAQKWAKSHGYALTNKNSHQGKNVYLECDRYSEYICLEGPTQRQSTTKKCGCKFSLRGSIPALSDINSEEAHTIHLTRSGYWGLVPLEILHNHPPSIMPSVHLISCFLNEKENVQAEGLMKANVRPNQILSQLYAQGNICTTSRTLYSYRGHLSIKERNGKSQLEYLIHLLKESNWIHSNETDINGKITNLFFAHSASIKLGHIEHHVILIDSTYRKCKYNLPLFHMVGQTATGHTFSLAFCYMERENDDGYIWALQELKILFQPPRIPKVIIMDCEPALKMAIELVFPSSIHNYCTWHISKNLIQNCRKYFQEDDLRDYQTSWNLLVSSKSTEEYKKNLEKFTEKSKDYPGSWAYISKNLLPFKKKFVTAWASQNPHLGNKASSRVESAHSYIK